MGQGTERSLASRAGRMIRRCARLYRLLWSDDRLSALEARVTGSEALEARTAERLAVLSAAAAQAHRQLDQLELFKSSLEVPHALLEEFTAWRSASAIPAEPLVSVCVATYDRARLLTERCLPSVLAQTYPRLELIVVGDGCTDDTESRIAKIHDARLRFINLPVRGQYPENPDRRWFVAGTHAMNAAMALARGDYVTHLDDDDEYLADRLEKLVRFAVAHACDFVWHPFWYEDGDGRWALNTADEFALGQVTTSSVLYRAWFARIQWDLDAYLLMEPGDWNRFRRIKYISQACMRYPEPLLRHYRERSMMPSSSRPGPSEIR